jgi:uncharacterized membrane protein YeaQ/YmgE (transglycosylase-associated protein family)
MEMSLREFMLDLGVKLPDLVAGFAGGVVNAFVFKRGTPAGIIGSVVVGALTANYLGDNAARFVGSGPGTSAFIVGLAGMAICQGLVEAIQRWRPFNGGRQ